MTHTPATLGPMAEALQTYGQVALEHAGAVQATEVRRAFMSGGCSMFWLISAITQLEHADDKTRAMQAVEREIATFRATLGTPLEGIV